VHKVLSVLATMELCAVVLCSDRTKKLASKASVGQSDTVHSSLNSTSTEVTDKQSTGTERLTPRALRYARRSAGLIEPGNQSETKANSSTAKSPAASHSSASSVSASRTTDLRGQSGRKRHRTPSAASEPRVKKVKKELPKSTSSSNTNSSYKPKQESVPKKQGTNQRSSKNTADRKKTHQQTCRKISNLERGKEKSGKSDKASSKATAEQPSVGATGAAHTSIRTKKRQQRSSAAAAVSSETSSDTAAGDTATGGTSQGSRTVRRRAATKRVGTLLTSSSHLTDTTGSCASSK